MSACFDTVSLGTRRSGGDASYSRQLARDLRRVLTVYHRAHPGGRGETINLRSPSDRLRHRPRQVSRTRDIHWQDQRIPIPIGVRPNSSDENSQPSGDFADPSTRP